MLLFHKYLFGKKDVPVIPDMDLTHAIGILRQVDLNLEERLLLQPDDGSASLVLSFAELAFVLEEAYQTLLHNS